MIFPQKYVNGLIMNLLLIMLFSAIGLSQENFGQEQEIDNLKNLLKKHTTKDTTHINLLCELGNKFLNYNIDKTFELAKEADQLSESLYYTKGKTNSYFLYAEYYKEKSDFSNSLTYLDKIIQITQETEDKTNLGRAYYKKGLIYNSFYEDYDASLEFLHKSLQIREKLGNKTDIAFSLDNIGSVYLKQGNFALASEYLHKSLQIKEELGNRKNIASSLFNLSNLYRHKGDYVLALEYIQKSLKIREDLGDIKGIASIYNNMGIVYKNQGNYSQALEFYQQSLKIKEELKDKKGISKTLNNIGIVYQNQGDYSQALEFYQQSLKIKEEHGNSRGISSVLHNMASIYDNINDSSKALEYYYRSLQISEDLGDKRGVANTLNNIGEVYIKQGNYKKALECYLKTLQIKESIGATELLPDTYSNIGACYLAKEECSKAFEYYQKALDLSLSIGQKKNEALCYKNFGAWYLAQHQPQQALKYAQKSYNLSKEIGNVEIQLESSGILTKIYEKLDKYKNAFLYQEIYRTMYDSLHNIEFLSQLKNMEYKAQYEKNLAQQKILTQKKQQRIRLLTIILILSFLFITAVLFYYLRIKEKNKNLFQKNLELTKISIDKGQTKGTTPSVNKHNNPCEGTDKELIEKMEYLLQTKRIYVDCQLGLESLAEMLETNRTYLSRIINNEYQCNFNKFINSYRVQEARRLLIQDDYKNLTLEGIAREVGFNSRSAFNIAFKDVTGIAPSYFRESVINQQS